ncbi:MAG: hypothetical protein Q4C83_03505, partial [Candidatus Saccharibacteria bacterium]|nr:hypothetical protein [Candidatus Saccharibacteria bacterium]
CIVPDNQLKSFADYGIWYITEFYNMPIIELFIHLADHGDLTFHKCSLGNGASSEERSFNQRGNCIITRSKEWRNQGTNLEFLNNAPFFHPKKEYMQKHHLVESENLLKNIRREKG